MPGLERFAACRSRSPPFARVVAPRLASWLGGPGRAAVIGRAVNAGGQLLWYTQIQARPATAAVTAPGDREPAGQVATGGGS